MNLLPLPQLTIIKAAQVSGNAIETNGTGAPALFGIVPESVTFQNPQKTRTGVSEKLLGLLEN